MKNIEQIYLKIALLLHRDLFESKVLSYQMFREVEDELLDHLGR